MAATAQMSLFMRNPASIPGFSRPKSGVYAPDSVLFRSETPLVFRKSCTNDRFQPGIVAIVEHWFSKPAGRRDLTLEELALGPVKSVIRAPQAGSEVYRDPEPAAPHPAARNNLMLVRSFRNEVR